MGVTTEGMTPEIANFAFSQWPLPFKLSILYNLFAPVVSEYSNCLKVCKSYCRVHDREVQF
jgi:hypothetical protein